MSVEEQDCRRAMAQAGFSTLRIKTWLIFGAKTQTCPVCFQPPGKPCLNMTDVSSKKAYPRFNSNPHNHRVDWVRIYDGLKYRGFAP